MKFTHNLPYLGRKLSYRFNLDSGIVTYKYLGLIVSIHDYYGLCIEDTIKADINNRWGL